MVRAIAHSGLPHWKHLLSEHAYRMPTRKVMIAKYVDGSLPTLSDTVAQKPPTTNEKIKRMFSGEKPEGPAGRLGARRLSRSARHAVGQIFCDRRLRPDPSHRRHAAILERSRRRRQADARGDGEIHACQQRLAQSRSACDAQAGGASAAAGDGEDPRTDHRRRRHHAVDQDPQGSVCWRSRTSSARGRATSATSRPGGGSERARLRSAASALRFQAWAQR